jgi:actin related protein 2/3 complex subunit 1A/1B
VATGAKCVSVCYFEEANDWWVSKHIKFHKSTVLNVAWHPNNIFLATAASDFKARIFSAFIKGVDKRPENTPFGDKLPFGEMLAEYSCGGWVRGVSWSPSGEWLSFVSHDSAISFVNISSGRDAVPQRLSLSGLPYRVLAFLNQTDIIAAGYDCNPALFRLSGQTWYLSMFIIHCLIRPPWKHLPIPRLLHRAFVKKVDESSSAARAAPGAAQSAMNMWQKKADLGTTSNETQLETKHQNAISGLTALAPNQFSTTAVDGKLIIWTVRA